MALGLRCISPKQTDTGGKGDGLATLGDPEGGNPARQKYSGGYRQA